MNDPDHPALRELLRTELRAGENQAPDFDAVWSAAAARHHRERTRTILTGIAALAALIAVCLFATHDFRPGKKRDAIAISDLPWRSVVLLTEWRTPTDALLPAPDPFSFQH